MITQRPPLFSSTVSRLTAAAALIAVTVAQGWILDEVPGLAAGHPRVSVVYLFDAVLLVAIATNAQASIRLLRANAGTRGVRVGALIVVAALYGLLVAPSVKGALIAYRTTGALLLGAAFLGMSDSERRNWVVVPAMAMATIQGLLATFQLASMSSLGLDGFGGGRPVVVDGVARAPGTLEHPYLLAAYALFALSLGIAFRPRPTPPLWLLGVAGSTIPIAVTFSRAAALGFLLVVGLAVLRAGRPEWRRIVAAMVIGFGIFAVAFAGSWSMRVADSRPSELGAGENVRYELAQQGLDLIGSDWLFGVGTGRYMIELESRFDISPRTANPVHNLPLYMVAEWGLVGWLVVVSFGWLALGAWRISDEARIVVLAPAGFFLFDALHSVYPIGFMLLVVTTMVIAALEASERAPKTRSTV